MALEVDIERAIEEAARRVGLSPREERILRYVIDELRRYNVLRKCMESWFGAQARYFPQAAMDNTVTLIARVLKRVMEELEKRGVQAEDVDIATAMQILPDYSKEAVESSIAAEEVLQTILGMYTAEEAENLADVLEKSIIEGARELIKELETLRSMDEKAYRRAVEQLRAAIEAVAKGVKRVSEEMERPAEIERVRREIEALKREIAELRSLITSLRTEARAAARAAARAPRTARERELATAPEKPVLTLDLVWGALNPKTPERREFLRFINRLWPRLSEELKYELFGGAAPRIPEVSERDKAINNEICARFVEWLRERFPKLYEVLEHMPSAPAELRRYGIDLETLQLVKLGRRGWEPASELKVARELKSYVPEQVQKLLVIGRKPAFGIKPTLYVVLPEHIYKVLGGHCPICCNHFFRYVGIEGGQCIAATCTRCLATYILCVDGSRYVVVLPEDRWRKIPGFSEEWEKKLRELEKAGWVIRIGTGITGTM